MNRKKDFVRELDVADYAPASTARIREGVEWLIAYSYNSKDFASPRVLLIGDSICNSYRDGVRDALAGKINVSFWASSKAVDDPAYFDELYYMLSAMRYDLITLNNGLHSLDGSDMTEWEECFRSAVKMIRDAQPGAKIAVTLTTAGRDERTNERVKEINPILLRVAEEFSLPVIDLFSITNSLDRGTDWADNVHFREGARAMLAKAVSDYALSVIGTTDGEKLGEAHTAMGPDGAI